MKQSTVEYQYTAVNTSFSTSDIFKSSSTRPCNIFQDFILEEPTKADLIVFRNFYCASVSIQHKYKNSSHFETIVSRLNLMEDPHYEDDAQNWFCIDLKKEGILIPQLHQLRFYYYQPSPNWRNICVRDLQFFKLEKESQTEENSLKSIGLSGDFNNQLKHGKLKLLYEAIEKAKEIVQFESALRSHTVQFESQKNFPTIQPQQQTQQPSQPSIKASVTLSKNSTTNTIPSTNAAATKLHPNTIISLTI